MAVADSSLDTLSSADLKKQLDEQTSNLEEAEPEETEEAEAVEQTEETEEEATEETTSEEEETTEEPPPKKKRDPKEEKLYKLKVEGKEELVPESKVIEYAQKGRFLERERQKQKEELERLRKTEQPPQSFDKTKINEEFLKELQEDAFGTLVKFGNTLFEQREGQTREERRAERKFQSEMETEVPYWKDLRPIYEEFRDMGHEKNAAFAMAEADYLKALLVRSREKGLSEGASKAKLKSKAVLPTGEKRTKGVASSTLPSEAELEKMTSAQMRKYLRMND